MSSSNTLSALYSTMVVGPSEAQSVQANLAQAQRRAEEQAVRIRKTLMRVEAKVIRLEREMTINQLQRVRAGWPGMEVRHLPLYWDDLDHDPHAENEDYFFRPMSPATIPEYPIMEPPAEEDEGVQGPSEDSETVNLEDGNEFEAPEANLEDLPGDDELDTGSGDLLNQTLVWKYAYPHYITAYRIVWYFTQAERHDFPGQESLFNLVNGTVWRYPSRLRRPEIVFGSNTAEIPMEETTGGGWFVRNAWISSEGHPHEVFVVANPQPASFNGGLVHGEVQTILTAMVNRYKNGRPYLKRRRVMPVMLISIIGWTARVIQAHFDGNNVVVRVSNLIDPEAVAPEYGYELFARYLASDPVGDTAIYPAVTSKRTADEAELDEEATSAKRVLDWVWGI
ncbi:hypothetical protein BDW62DRAFT_199709 [Aspergillus aurantiobrunneus]